METPVPYAVAVVAFGDEVTDRWKGHWTLMRSDASHGVVGEGEAPGTFETEEAALAAARSAGNEHARALSAES